MRAGAEPDAGSHAGSELLIATGSADKLREIRRILDAMPVRLLGLNDLDRDVAEPDEPHDTFVGNALHKARHYAAVTGLATIADDSGLCVDALGGAPGVRSRRFAAVEEEAHRMDDLPADRAALDRRNNELLLERLAGMPPEMRGAHYVCAAACVRPDGRRGAMLAVGTVTGRITDERRGSAGFGYDPLFLIPRDGRTFAEMSAAEKHALSHRGRAFRAMRVALAG